MHHSERFNSYSHLIGLILATAGTAMLITFSALEKGAAAITSSSVYGAMLILLYASSTLYHSATGPIKKTFQKLDHICIYLLIAGTYTPYVLVSLKGGWGWALFGTIWGLACLGIIQECLPGRSSRAMSYILYILMGWLVIIAFHPLIRALPPAGLAWLITGGLLYTLGLPFYALEGKIRHAHGYWHICVLLASASQYYSIFRYVI